MSIDVQPAVAQFRRVVIAPPDPVIADRGRARSLRERFLEELVDPDDDTPIWVDLNQIQVLTIGAADELIVQWLARLHARRYRTPVVFATYSQEVRDTLDAALRAAGQAAYRVRSAPISEPIEPIGDVSATARETLDVLWHAGTDTTLMTLAERLDMAKTAVANRLSDLMQHGLVQVRMQPNGARTYTVLRPIAGGKMERERQTRQPQQQPLSSK